MGPEAFRQVKCRGTAGSCLDTGRVVVECQKLDYITLKKLEAEGFSISVLHLKILHDRGSVFCFYSEHHRVSICPSQKEYVTRTI